MTGHTYEYREYGSHGLYVVHEWGVYPEHSVLAGQARKTFVDSDSSRPSTIDSGKAMTHSSAVMPTPLRSTGQFCSTGVKSQEKSMPVTLRSRKRAGWHA